ncbi:transcriptional regulator, SarA/Rot family [Macrococcus carouselicus]|uniref:Transcriptional regulator SarA/SarZ/Rot-like helix-turn-helix domain-containing protein n=1 Tax=Macrococcus carouselicus TaxID=69969 RepID=A0A9Q8CGF4_9STAP|nr:hypothetical protein [Macrococcus carouselicus]TDM00799.1 hypothetical protein ERX40_08285 [Macrococcus carouselicus]
MSTKQSAQLALDFFAAINSTRAILDEFSEKYRLNLFDLELLLIIYKHREIQLRTIIQEEMIKANQINKSVKNLYDLKLINKERLPMDERTVQLSIRESSRDKVEHLIERFSDKVRTINLK